MPEMAVDHQEDKRTASAILNYILQLDENPLSSHPDRVPLRVVGEPRLIGKHERRFTGFDDKIVAMNARGMTVREIQGFLSQMYATDVTPDFISGVTDAVLAEVTAWQSRSLESMYPVIFFDACARRFGRTTGCATKHSTWPWARVATARATSSACGSITPKVPNSG